jgi:hypothetical protein
MEFFGDASVWTDIAFCGFGDSEFDDSELELWAE